MKQGMKEPCRKGDSESILTASFARVKGSAGQLSHALKPPPSRRHRGRYGQNAHWKKKFQISFERRFQTRPPRGVLHGRKSRFPFADAHNAWKQRPQILSSEPRESRVAPRPDLGSVASAESILKR
jgi:hypothetical protein